MQTQKFISFIESMKTHNPALIEAIEQGFKACFEAFDSKDKGAQYTSVVSMQGSDAREVLNMLADKGKLVAFNYLKQLDNDEGGKEYNEAPWGSHDFIFKFGRYYLSYNFRNETIALTKKNW